MTTPAIEASVGRRMYLSPRETLAIARSAGELLRQSLRISDSGGTYLVLGKVGNLRSGLWHTLNRMCTDSMESESDKDNLRKIYEKLAGRQPSTT